MISRTEETLFEGWALYRVVTWRFLWIIPVVTFKTRIR